VSSRSGLDSVAGVTAIRQAGGPIVPWTPGRTDYSDAQAAASHRGDSIADKLPDGAKGADHLRDVFGRMGFSGRSSSFYAL
jgi:cytochrome c peroxidase